jgi:hypothetical protein
MRGYRMKNRVLMMTAALLIGLALLLPTLRSRRVAAQSPGLMGSYGFTASAPYTGANNSGPIALVGVITFDGAGNLTGSETVVQPDPSPNATTVQSQRVPFAGTYAVNADGTGTLMLQIPGVGQPVPVSLVVTDGGSGIMFVQTAAGNSLLTGMARKQ